MKRNDNGLVRGTNKELNSKYLSRNRWFSNQEPEMLE
jgi:hypothetical protein